MLFWESIEDEEGEESGERVASSAGDHRCWLLHGTGATAEIGNLIRAVRCCQCVRKNSRT